MQGPWYATLWIFVLASAIIILTSAALTGWFLGPTPWIERILLLAAAAGLVSPSGQIVALAAAVATGCAIWHVVRHTRERPAA